MSTKQDKEDFVRHVVDLLQTVGPVTSRRMFGGHGVFLDGLMFGLIDNNELYFKADEQSQQEILALGLQAFTYQKQGKEASLSYYQAPEEALEHSEEMRKWGNLGFACALRAAAKKPKRRESR